ncbi:site-specific DNA-methyltransferase [Spirosoma utsteinense]|uniref:site-specific DNA-methyltransferase n=1 Tax=Spirosoma utsteinense TaxID=2585773 RepID=UPI001ABC1FF5|nr:site-specific DNA-methyltransferase [Spirosoma utsteinense]MBC3788643.1 adenine-specific DNA-methyltransferase [Spirosoma utsteinense]
MEEHIFMDGTSLDISADLISQLKAIVPQAFSEDKIDFKQLQTLLGQAVNTDSERYQLSWAGKSEAYKILQTPTMATLHPQPDQSIDWDNAEHVLIEGENLEVLKVLQKSYYGKIKMIYIDPPYNTGNDSFIYPDKFSETKEEYLKRISDKDDEGFMLKEGLFRKNSKENGQFHSNWLNMMLPRLFLARNLLKEDGVIFVSIDDNEQANLKLLMDEIFGIENFVAVFPWKKRSAKSDVPFGVSQDYEWIICYSKAGFGAGLEHERKYYQTDDIADDRWRLSDLTTQRSAEERPNSAFNMIDPKTKKSYNFNPQRVWGVSKDTFQYYYDKNKIVFPDDYEFLNIGTPAFRVFESEDKEKAQKKFGSEVMMKAASTLLPKEVGMSEDGNKEMVELFGFKAFSFPKPTGLVKHFINLINDKEALILDFFAGSGTAAQAVLELNEQDGGNRKCICVQLPELTEEKGEAYKAGYKTIAAITQERIRRVVQKINDQRKGSIKFEESRKLGFRKYFLAGSNFKIWRSDVIENEEDLKNQLQLFITPERPNAQSENMLWELLIKNGISLTARIQQSIITSGEVIYYTQDKRFAFALGAFSEAVQSQVLALKPKTLICLDSLFTGRDNEKTNAQLKFEDNGITFKTI